MSEKERKVETKNLTNPYEPTPHERAAAKAYFARKEKSVPSPRMKVSMRETWQRSHRIIQTPELGTYWIDSNFSFPRLTAARTRLGSAVQTKGLGSELVSSTNRLIAA